MFVDYSVFKASICFYDVITLQSNLLIVDLQG